MPETDVLVIDDDPEFLDFATRTLGSAGVSVETVPSATEALEKLRTLNPRLILLDWHMPGASGMEVLAQLGHDAKTADIPVWMCSSRNDEVSICDAYVSGVGDYLAKPIPPRVFSAKVKGYLESRAVRHLQHITERLNQLEPVALSVERASKHITKLMPSPGAIPQLDIGVVYHPQEAIGGDFYDVFRMRNGNHAILLGDVRGHGVEAAVIQTMARKVIQMQLRQAPTLEHGLVRANQELREDLPTGQFIALVAAEWIPERRLVRLFRMGAPHPLLRRAARSRRAALDPSITARQQAAQMLVTDGVVLGVAPTPQFKRSLQPLEFWLDTGDLLLLHTDGAMEAEQPDGTPFGIDRLRIALGTVRADSAKGVVDHLYDTIAMAADGGIGDDVTLLALQSKAQTPE